MKDSKLEDPIVEEEFDYKGHHCIILYMPDMGHRCGYLSIPEELAGIEWDEVFWLHGGITFQGNMHHIRKDDPRNYIGFDCMHAGDRMSFHSPHLKLMPKSLLAKKNNHYWTRKDVKKELKQAINEFQIGKTLIKKFNTP